MNKPSLRIDFIDIFSSFDKRKNLIYDILSKKYDCSIDRDHPDVVFYSSYGWEHLYHKDCLRIFETTENHFPDFNTCDYALSPMRENINGKNFWHPYYMRLRLEKKTQFPKDAFHRPFACFIADNSSRYGSKYRENFVRKLLQYKHIDCPGRVLHNIDIPELDPRRSKDWHISKARVISRYKFIIAFENSNTDGYITEKLVDGFLSNVVPIYWGSEGNTAPFPKEAMICANDYPDMETLIERIREVDEDEQLYSSILQANPLYDEKFIEKHMEYLRQRESFLEMIAQDALTSNRHTGAYFRRTVGPQFPIEEQFNWNGFAERNSRKINKLEQDVGKLINSANILTEIVYFIALLGYQCVRIVSRFSRYTGGEYSLACSSLKKRLLRFKKMKDNNKISS